MYGTATPDDDRHRQRAGLQRLAHLLDSAIPLPGGLRIGLDGIIGLIPGLGDVVGAALSSYIVAQAYRLGASRSVIAHMAGNIALDTLIGTIPFLGDLFDFAWKANRRNVDLLERHLAQPRQTRRQSSLLIVGVTAGGVILLLGIVYLLVALVHWMWTSLSS
ncbi:DUF4112 domain-containing protein [Thiohalobacter thiocyanaticus]|nr:DUF4112 domain-containing protein [Thiohalobacter thiocyanaticus]